MTDVFWEAIVSRATGVLGLLDRERMSGTFGCMDRTFWAWKFVDFPGARFQEGLCALAYLYATPGERNPYHASPRLLEWIAGGFDFWSRIQRKDGDFDEAYPLERSLAATAFTSFYLSEAFGFAGEALPRATRERFLAALGRAGDWLTRNDETHGILSNHLAAAAAALYHAYRLTGEERYEARCRMFLERILAHQSAEGWYEEYGGADPGYQTHGSFYLARLLELGVEGGLAESLERSFAFLAHFVHPDRSLGGEYTSRNTQTYYPAAFEMLAHRSGAARWIADEMRPAVTTLSAAGLGSVDVYNLFPLLNNYVFAHRAVAGRPAAPRPPEPPDAAEGLHHFPEAGLLKVRRARYDLYVGLRKGGALKLFDREARRHVASDCGYVGRLAGGRVFSSQWTDPETRCQVDRDELQVEGGFFEISRPVMDPYRFLAFRVFSLTLGRFPRAARWLKALLVRTLIYRKRGLDLRLSRRIRLEEGAIEIRDVLSGGLGPQVRELWQEDVFTTIHMGSSRYFLPNELETPGLPESRRRVDPADIAARAERVRRVALD